MSCHFQLCVLTVDGRNPASVEVGSLSHYLQGFSTIPGGFLAGFLNHQQDHGSQFPSDILQLQVVERHHFEAITEVGGFG